MRQAVHVSLFTHCTPTPTHPSSRPDAAKPRQLLCEFAIVLALTLLNLPLAADGLAVAWTREDGVACRRCQDGSLRGSCPSYLGVEQVSCNLSRTRYSCALSRRAVDLGHCARALPPHATSPPVLPRPSPPLPPSLTSRGLLVTVRPDLICRRRAGVFGQVALLHPRSGQAPRWRRARVLVVCARQCFWGGAGRVGGRGERVCGLW